MICPRCKKPIADHDAGRETAACSEVGLILSLLDGLCG